MFNVVSHILVKFQTLPHIELKNLKKKTRIDFTESVNQLVLHWFISRLNFSLSEDENENTLVLDLAVYR